MPITSRRIFAALNWTSGTSPIRSGCLLCGGQNQACGGNEARSTLLHGSSRFPSLARLDESFLVLLLDYCTFVCFRGISPSRHFPTLPLPPHLPFRHIPTASNPIARLIKGKRPKRKLVPRGFQRSWYRSPFPRRSQREQERMKERDGTWYAVIVQRG